MDVVGEFDEWPNCFKNHLYPRILIWLFGRWFGLWPKRFRASVCLVCIRLRSCGHQIYYDTEKNYEGTATTLIILLNLNFTSADITWSRVQFKFALLNLQTLHSKQQKLCFDFFLNFCQRFFFNGIKFRQDKIKVGSERRRNALECFKTPWPRGRTFLWI